MKHPDIFFLFAIAAGILAACVFLPRTAPLIPREILFGNPEKAQPQISPDGKKIAYLAPEKGVLNIWIRSVQGGDDRVVTHDKGRGIRDYFWASDSRHLFFLQDHDGDENAHLFIVDGVSGEQKNLTPFPGTRVQILAVDKHFPDMILLGMNRENPKFYDAYQLNWRTGELTLLAKNDGTVSDWIADRRLAIRGALKSTASAGYTVMIRADVHADWLQAAEWGLEDNLSTQVLGFSNDGQALYLVDSRDAAVGRLVKLDIASGKTEILAEDPESDIVSVWIHPETYVPQMASVIKEKVERIVFDATIRADIKKIKKDHGPNFQIVARDDADKIWILRVESDQAPVGYFVYDRPTQHSTFLFEHQPALKKYKLAAMKPVSFQSRDGLLLHGYLTLPFSDSAPASKSEVVPRLKKPWPLVLKVHGGPWSRDVWGYDARVQWLANRGYAVLQVNFRGSTTYGKVFLNAGDKEWGGKMQDDLTDAVAWAVQEGIADPKRIAIFGGSYGGYAALAGAVFTPELFRAAIALVGPSNLISFIQSTPPYWATELANIKRRVGDPQKDEALLKSRSPLFFAGRIRIPILIAQGANDPRVKKAESDQIVEELKKHGISYQYMLFPDEGHGFAKPENQLKFYQAVELFLAKNLGGRVEK